MLKMNVQSLLLLLSVVAMSLVSCNKDDEKPQSEKTLVEIASEDAQFSTLVSALQRTGLDAVLNNENANFTVFAPTNAAFQALGVDLNTLTDAQLSGILLYHVLGAKVKAGGIADGQTYVTTAAETGPGNTQLSMLIEKAGASVKINGSINVTATDIEGINGVIHVIDAVIMPLDIVGHAAANSNFSQLVGALGNASGDLVNVLKGNGPFTVFAPLNSAFAEIASTVATLNADQLAKVLTYHVVAGANVRSTALTNGQNVATVNGESFTVNLGSKVTITDAKGNTAEVVLTDVQATNGVIHVLNKVILPETI